MTIADQTTETSRHIAITPGATESTRSLLERHVPLTIPGAQEYYWHFEWQSGEREALAELETGQSVRFDGDDPQDIARWLDAPDAADAD